MTAHDSREAGGDPRASLWFQQLLHLHRPETPGERMLLGLAGLPGLVGRSAARKLRRRYLARSERGFFRLLDSLPANALCIDLGANVGKVSKQMLDRGKRVIAFEPDPATFAELTRRIGGRPGLRLVQAAAGTAPGTAELRRAHDWDPASLKNSVSSSLVHTDAKMDGSNTETVEVVDFAAFLIGLGEPVGLLKIDIEGGEWALIPHLDAMGAFDRVAHVLVETHEWRDPSRLALAAKFRAMAKSRQQPRFDFDWV